MFFQEISKLQLKRRTSFAYTQYAFTSVRYVLWNASDHIYLSSIWVKAYQTKLYNQNITRLFDWMKYLCLLKSDAYKIMFSILLLNTIKTKYRICWTFHQLCINYIFTLQRHFDLLSFYIYFKTNDNTGNILEDNVFPTLGQHDNTSPITTTNIFLIDMRNETKYFLIL